MSKEAVPMNPVRRLTLVATLATLATLLLATSAGAVPAAELHIESLSNTTASSGETFRQIVQVTNAGQSELQGGSFPIVLTGTLPSGLTLVSAEGPFGGCTSTPTGFSCERVESMQPKLHETVTAQLAVDPGVEPGEVLTTVFRVEGGDPSNPSATTADPIRVAAKPPPFGLDAFDAASFADPQRMPFTQAAGHPYDFAVNLDFNTATDPIPAHSSPWPRQPLRDASVELPPGLVGSASGLPQCTVAQLVNGPGTQPEPICESESQIGVTTIRFNNSGLGTSFGPLPVFNLVPAPGDAARFGYNVAGTVVLLDAHIRNGSDYGITVTAFDVSEGLAVTGAETVTWGDPADPLHTPDRACPGKRAPWDGNEVTCASPTLPAGFLRQPTSCAAEHTGLPFNASIYSWPGSADERSIRTHLPKGYPYTESEWGEPQGPTGCAAVSFNPGLSAEPTTNTADSPTGLNLHLTLPQDCWQPRETPSQVEGQICQSDLKGAEVKLPQGMTLNPSAASGLGACSETQIGYKPDTSEPFEFTPEPAACPDSSKIGKVSIKTPLLEEELTGAVYLAKQTENPFGSLLAMYLVAENAARGVVVKQAGEVGSDPGTGRLVTRFDSAPQAPFSDLHVSLFGGPRAALRTPPTCGTYGVSAKLTPWSGNAPVTVGSAFEVESCPNGGFDPKLTAGTQNPLAGSYSPFNLRLSREDGTQQIAGLTAALPEGLIGKPAGIPYCPDSTLAAISGDVGTGVAQEQHPSCPAVSQVGTVTAGAGAGPEPFYTQSGRAYLAGPYMGAPLSLAVVTPAVAGPFDLGTVVVRNALRVDPETAKITAVSDPIPTILHGIPLDLRDVRVSLERNQFTLNPTSCEPMSIGSTVTGAQGATASPSARFQVAACSRLGFKPKLSLKLKGKTNRGADPALTAVLKARPGDANIGRVSVALPRSEFLDNAHIKTICTRVQFAAGLGNGADCPAGSVYGHATATSPLLDQPLSGPVYLRSSSHELPDLVFALNGQIDIAAVGRIDSVNGGIRSTFETVPDAPLTKVVLNMAGGKKGLLENSTNICKGTHRATADFEAHNAKGVELIPTLKPAGCGKARKSGRTH